MNTRKSPGTNNICIELLKTDVITAVGNVVTDLFNDIWTTNEIPRNWNKDLTLVPMPNKIFCRVLHNRIEEDIDINLRQEQAGFRRGKGDMDQIVSEWNTPLCIGFIDFKKAFYSIHHETL